MDVSLFDYELPEELIAQEPVAPRDASRLLVLSRGNGTFAHDIFRNLVSYLRPADCLVVNETRVMPARLLGRKEGTGGRVELLLLRPRTDTVWETLAKPGRRLQIGAKLEFGAGHLRAQVVDRLESGGRVVRFETSEGTVGRALKDLGHVPLPPYIHEPLADAERYQTVYAVDETSVAAPTAGLHFTPALLDQIRGMGVEVAAVRLTVGLDTFRPVTAETVEEHAIHSEKYELDGETARRVNQARDRGGRVIAVGTTSVRVLETVADEAGRLSARSGSTQLFIYPGYRFKTVDALVTNFHLPRSSLLMMVSAFAGRELIMEAYREAIKERYRFFSFGDAMLVL